MKNLLELHADASDEVSLLDDSEVVQYVVGDVRDCLRAGLCCYVVSLARDVACASASSLRWLHRRAPLLSLWPRALPPVSLCPPLPERGCQERGEEPLGLGHHPNLPVTLVVLTSDAAACVFFGLVFALWWPCAMGFLFFFISILGGVSALPLRSALLPCAPPFQSAPSFPR